EIGGTGGVFGQKKADRREPSRKKSPPSRRCRQAATLQHTPQPPALRSSNAPDQHDAIPKGYCSRKNSPARVALIRLESVPPMTALRPRRAMSRRRLGTMLPRPPSRMAMEVRLAKPQRAKVTMTCVCGVRDSLMPTKLAYA